MKQQPEVGELLFAIRHTFGLVFSVALRVSRSTLLETEVRRAESEHAVVVLAGELDTSTVGQLYEELAELTREGVRHLVIDVAELDFVDSTGLSAIIAAHKRVEASGGELIVLDPSRDMRRLFEITGIDNYLNIRPSEAASTLGSTT